MEVWGGMTVVFEGVLRPRFGLIWLGMTVVYEGSLRPWSGLVGDFRQGRGRPLV